MDSLNFSKLNNEFIILVNSKAHNANLILRYFKINKVKYLALNKGSDFHDVLKMSFQKGIFNFVICGGDGTVNKYVNALMCFPKNQREKVKAGFIACGKTNDFIKMMGISLDIESNISKILDKKYIPIDLIKVNDYYFITGGGLGLSAEVVSKTDLFLSHSLGKLFVRGVKDFIYYFFVIKMMLFGYSKIKECKIKGLHYSNLMTITLHNQPFIGKRFFLAPDAKNNDGIFECCIIKDNGCLGNLHLLHKIIKGKHIYSKVTTYLKLKNLLIETDENLPFMADGELITSSKLFRLRIYPRAINVYL